uniref:Tbc2 translation factor, chloroplastic n=1 Tax=Chlamydomonas reinhardtii TaxID=3055 RepID=TBC2_CHLRE|nr:RecName: Full=Tbc2 translation factor, chloroplastic; Flags: Precursor [Chlamydomonas reinhardtii]CAD20887.1 Tbc2 translation factor [Chlamydomonas reinhardtii]
MLPLEHKASGRVQATGRGVRASVELSSVLPQQRAAQLQHQKCNTGARLGRDPRRGVDAERTLVCTAATTASVPSTSGASPSGSQLSSKALRPRRFSAPVIARLLRSTTTVQELADLVQQQSLYMDSSHVGIAMLHLALLVSRAEQQAAAQLQLQLAAKQAATRRAGSGASTSGRARGWGSGPGRNGSGSSSVSVNGSGSSSNGSSSSSSSLAMGMQLSMASIGDDVVSGVNAGPVPSGGADALLDLEMSSILDDDDGAGARQLQQMSDDLAAGLEAAATTTAAPEAGVAAAGGTGAGAAADAAASSSAPSLVAAAAAAAAAAASPASSPDVARTLRTLLSRAFSLGLDSLSGPQLAAVFTGLAVLRRPRQQQQQQQQAGAAGAGANAGAGGVGGVGVSAGDRLVAEQLLAAMGPKLYECRPQDLANTLASVALLGLPPDADLRTSFYAAVRQQQRRFGPRELATTLWAYGAMGTYVQEDAVQLVLELSRARLTSFSPLQLAKAVQGLAALRYRPSPEWVEAYCSVLRPALRRMSSRELCAVLLALASLQVGLDGGTRAALLVHTFSGPLPGMAPGEVALSLWALGRLSAVDMDLPALIDLDMSGRVLDLTSRLLAAGGFSGGELQQLLEGLTRLALQPPLEWMQAFVAALQPQLDKLDAQQLAGVLNSLAAQQYRPQPQMQEVVLAATQANMKQLLADTTCSAALLTALRRLNIEPPPGWVGALLEESRSALKNRCTDLHLANLAGSLAAWGVRPDGRWAARLMWRSQVLMNEDRMSPRALVALLQAMVSLGLSPNPVWTQLCLQAAVRRASQPAFEPHHYGTLMASLHALGIQPPQEWLTRMLLSTYRCWDRFSVTHWSSLLPALVLLKARPPREWLRRFEATSAARLADCSALQLLTLAVSLAQLHQLHAAGAVADTPLLLPGAAAAAAAAAPAGASSAAAAGDSPAALSAVPAAAGDGALVPSFMSIDDDGTAAVAAAATALAAAEPAAHAATSTTTATAVAHPQPQLLPQAQALPQPGPEWQAAWWAASTRLLLRVRYAPSELVLTAGWLGSLGLRPPPEWLQACAEVAARYSKVMDAAERQQLAAAVAPLALEAVAPPSAPPAGAASTAH